MSVTAQSRLLRVVETRELLRVGGRAPIKIDVRIIAATNGDLESMIERREFLPDLYYRLAGLKLHVPPLRDRVEDIPGLAAHFLQIAARGQGKRCEDPVHIPRTFLSYAWPGNARELRGVVDLAVALAGDTVRQRHLEESWRLSISRPTDAGGMERRPDGAMGADVRALARQLQPFFVGGPGAGAPDRVQALADHLMKRRQITRASFRKLAGARSDSQAYRRLRQLVKAKVLYPPGKGGGARYELRDDLPSAASLRPDA